MAKTLEVHVEACNVDRCPEVPTVTVRRLLPILGPKLRLWVCGTHAQELAEAGYDVQLAPSGLRL